MQLEANGGVPRPGHRTMRATAVLLACSAVVALVGCGIVQVSKNTRYFATDKDAGKTIQLHKGDEVTLNLVISNGRDWNALSGDVNIAKPSATEVMNFSNGEKSRLFDFALVGTGHVQLVACPLSGGTCSPSAPGALTFDVDVA